MLRTSTKDAAWTSRQIRLDADLHDSDANLQRRGNSMKESLARLGPAVRLGAARPISNRGGKAAGFGWEVTDGAKADIEKMEANSRKAGQVLGSRKVR